eukprot:s367_g7.t3
MTNEEFNEIFSQVGGVDGYQVIYLASPLRTRTTKDVLYAAQDLYLRLKAQGCPVARVHSDRARELRSEPLKRWLASRGTYTTYTEGQSPQSNGWAESAVRFVKSNTKRLLKMANLDGRMWPMALQYSMWSQMQKQLYPDKVLIPFGTRVHVKKKVYGTGGKYDLESRWDVGQYLGPSRDVNEGSVIMMGKGNFITATHLRPGLIDMDKEVELEDYHALIANPSRRLRRKSTLNPEDYEGLPALPQPEVEGEEGSQVVYDPTDPVEEYARAVLKEGRIERDYVESLARLLPEDGAKPKRFGDKSDDEVIWASGAFVHGGVVGVLNNAKEYPRATKVFLDYLKQQCPGIKCNSIAVFKGIQAEPHRDAHNVGDNVVVPLSEFEGCDIVVKENGKEIKLKVSEGPQRFNPHHGHYTTACTKGTSWMLVGYSIRDSVKLKVEAIDLLEDLGFSWDPHRSKEEEVVAAKELRPRLAMMRAEVKPNVEKENHKDPSARSKPGLEVVNNALDIVIQDMEERAGRLRDLLEEEEIMAEQASRLGRVVHKQLMQFQRIREKIYLKAAKPSEGGDVSVDYERLLEELEGDLDVIYTVPLDQVRRVLQRWTKAIEKEVEYQHRCVAFGFECGVVPSMDCSYRRRYFTAFLLAEWPAGMPRYALAPPKIIRESGDYDDSLWMVQRPLYGLRESPVIWSQFRNARLREVRVVVRDRELGLKQLGSESELWLLSDLETGELYGILVVHVDDLMYLGAEEHKEIASLWPTSALEWVGSSRAIRYLGDLECDKTSEPSFTEEDLKLGQRLVGEALWLAAKTRPDIMYVVNAMASHVARKPLQVTRMGKRLLAYLAGTVDLTLVLTSPREGEDKKITCFTALRMRASLLLEPGAMELRLSHMAELQSPGRRANKRYSLLESISASLQELEPGKFSRVLAIDNSSTVAMCNGGPGSQRTRHLKVRAAYIREAVAEGRLQVQYTPGEQQLADMGTKLLTKERLWQLLGLWGFVGGKVARMIEAIKMKMLAVIMMLIALVTPADGAVLNEGQDGIQVSGWDELLIVSGMLCVTAIACWELAKYLFRLCWKAYKGARKSIKLNQARDLQESRAVYQGEVAQIRESGGEVAEDEAESRDPEASPCAQPREKLKPSSLGLHSLSRCDDVDVGGYRRTCVRFTSETSGGKVSERLLLLPSQFQELPACTEPLTTIADSCVCVPIESMSLLQEPCNLRNAVFGPVHSKAQRPPGSGKYDAGWLAGTPAQGKPTKAFFVNII